MEGEHEWEKNREIGGEKNKEGEKQKKDNEKCHEATGRREDER